VLILVFLFLSVGFDFGCNLLLGGRFCDGRMNAGEFFLGFILVVNVKLPMCSTKCL
jgi:hypothetical protein